ncbi:nonstructural protein [Dipodfec virus RodF1_64]|uniref:Nonstructural protein n=1 Tax=Dipodfec virus RodF1_64 TaxID=2929306 RepID=A0A976R7W7_9VIRU|nr:nonstructural protein [Dipodfec virus RodF1_64]
MKVCYYSIKDNVSGHFGPLVSAINDDVAKREIRSLVSLPDSPFSKYPADYDLYYLGELNDETGTFESDVSFICSLVTVKPLEVIKFEKSDVSDTVQQ